MNERLVNINLLNYFLSLVPKDSLIRLADTYKHSKFLIAHLLNGHLPTPSVLEYYEFTQFKQIVDI